MGHFQVLGPLLDRHAPGHFAHGSEQGQGAIVLLNGFIGDADRAAVHQGPGQVLAGRQVQVGKEDLAPAQQRVFRGLRLLDMHDHIGPAIDLLRGVNDLRPVGHVFLVGEGGADAAVFFHQDFVPGLVEDFHSGRRH